ncbi:isoprenoid synthase domain-containing protein [Fomitopsis serialis]|uniref:isoprenoid synthase domain-containing protein n=1 Tax=Fomitopsis serialis TaxID=139415 RepID=UPI002008AA1C|nr:isoprenoid synthase domain-containing protein [Neoantrodia serialis]KAH9926937.1 isoprenoid synthase domain-containing protein [Neoantrodia serialis]
MTLPDEKKQPILRRFHELTVTPGWTFTENGPNEKDRQLLVEYNVVSDELLELDAKYRDVILDITVKMQTGMADYAHRAATTGEVYVEKISEYELYCHYVAGLVGEGVTRLFSVSGKEAPWLGDQLELSNSMGLMLQKTNIIRDYREDVEDKRYFWPREIWGREIYGKAVGKPAFTEMAQMYQPGNEKQALWVQSGMVVDALRHAVDSLDYLRLLKTQSMFQRNIKIRKAEAASLIMRSTNPRDVAYIFRDYARKIHSKATSEDPSFLQISVACGKIEQWCEQHYPSFVSISASASGGRQQIAEAADKQDQERAWQKRLAAAATNGKAHGAAKPLGDGKEEFKDILLYVFGAFVLVFGLGIGGIWLFLHYYDKYMS